MRPAPKTQRAAAPRKAPKGPKVDHARAALKMRKAIADALAEVKTARRYMEKQFAGPEQEALSWAESILSKASAL